MEEILNSANKKEDIPLNDLHMIWAIRDISSSILDFKKKGILCLFVACIGKKKFCWRSMDQLAEIFGKSERRLREEFHCLEDMNFLIIDRPPIYSRGLSNHYSLNRELILETANQCREKRRRTK
jgi:hypothetical protein